MSKPKRDRHYQRQPIAAGRLGPLGALATVASGAVDRDIDLRIDFPEAYAKRVGLEYIRRCL